MWAYFFQRAPYLTRQELVDRLADPVFAEAAGVLEMIARTPEERELYEARLKLQRDEQSRIAAAEERGEESGEARGREEGAAKGALAGRIQLLEELLGERPTALEKLIVEPDDELGTRLRELQERLRSRE